MEHEDFFWTGFTSLRPALAALRRGRQDLQDIFVFRYPRF